MDPTLFANANLDPQAGTQRIFVAGTRRVDNALNSKRYSRALQANTQHYYRVTCGSDVVTGTFTTANPPLGNAYPELPNFDTTSFGNVADPTIDWTDKSQSYIDPMTGILLKRVTGPGENGYKLTAVPFDYALDASGAWTNPAGGTGRGGAASTTTPNAPLFLSWNELHNYQYSGAGANFNPLQGTVDDMLLRITGSGLGTTVSACISLDSGKTCASTSLPLGLPDNTPAAVTPIPASYPTPLFAGWGKPFSDWDISNKSGYGASAGGQSVTVAPGNFNVDWPAGVKIRIAGSGCNGTDVCTIAALQSSAQLTTVENIPNAVSNAAWQVYAAGIRISMLAGSKASVSATYEYAESQQNLMADNTAQSYCSELKVTDINKDKDGNPLPGPLSGRLCNFKNGLYLAVDGTGEFRLLSTFVMNSKSPMPGVPINVATNGAFSGSDPKTFYGNAYYHQGLYKGTYTGDYTTYKSGGTSGYAVNTPVDDAVAWTNIMAPGSPSDIAVQLPKYPGMGFDTPALFAAPNFAGVLAGYGEFFVSPLAGSDPICVAVRYNLETQQISQALSSWTTYPMRWGGCHFSPKGASTYQVGTFNPLNGQNSNNPLNGPFQLPVLQVKKNIAADAGNGGWSNNTAMTESVLLTASNTSPAVITTGATYSDGGYMATNAHGLLDGEPVVIWGATGNTAINTPGGGTYYAKASWSDSTLATAVGLADTAITVANGSRMTANAMLQIDSEYIRCANLSGNILSGCTRAAWGSTAATHANGAVIHQANSFALYQDASLTQPVAGNGVYQVGSGYVMDLDTCPSNLDTRWTSAMIGDSGATGRRCTTIRVKGEPASSYAYWTTFPIGGGLASVTVSGNTGTIKLTQPYTSWAAGQKVAINGANLSSLDGTFNLTQIVDSLTANFDATGITAGVHTESTLYVKHATEHYLYPWKGDLTNLNLSSLQDVQEGDFLHDFAGGPDGEQLIVVKKVKNSEADVELTVMRYWGSTFACDFHTFNTAPTTHKNGWSAYMVPSFGCWGAEGFANISDASWSVGDRRYASEHGDFGPGSQAGTFTYVSSGYFTPVANLPFSQLMLTGPSYNVIHELPVFAGSNLSISNDLAQGYGAYRQSTAPAAEKVWKSDFHALNNSYGAGQDSPVGLVQGMSFSNIRGSKYDTGGQTSNVYKVLSLVSGVNHKLLPLTGFAGLHYMGDMSGPASLIGDSNRYNLCLADFAGECRPGSAAGDLFVNLPAPDFSSGGWCITNSYEYNTPCIFTASSQGGWAVQQRIDPPDTSGTGGRRMTMGFVNPGRHFSFTNWVASPDAQWGFLSPPWVNGLRNDIFAMKLPPWPAADNVDRSNFVPLAIPVTAMPNAVSARAQFGYAENGPAGSFYCTARKEACTTAGSPFAWLSEPQTPTACTSGCTVNIPAIAGRIVYYKIEWLDAVGRVLSSSAVNAIAAAP